MRGGKVTEWADALDVPPKELPDALRRLYRESVTLHEELIHSRQKVHERPLVHIDEALARAESALREASDSLSFAHREASREVY
jgi:hypothetical protein